ncbi:MAG TPA: RluA family pseudouridine synthase [Blastocatellia bacterium]|nr:RluA family pseudouridine synthase [Blastocatellia bacterium]
MSQSFHFRITEEDAGRRLDEFLASRFGQLSRMRIGNLVSAGACKINRLEAQRGWRISAGDLVEIAFDEGPPTAMEPDDIPLEVAYEDEHLIVVVKPAGMLAHPTRNVKRGTLANALAYHLNQDFYSALRTPAHGERHSLTRPGLAHRLDRATSGLMVVAKTHRALSRLSDHFHRRLVEKRYLALVGGRVGEDAGEIKAPIGRDINRLPLWWVMEGGKPAVTRFSVSERFDRATLLELEPVTGRTNQLRIHCAYYGHPILGDELYFDCGLRIAGCGLKDMSMSLKLEIRNQESATRNPQSAILNRLCLHACRLAFHHPVGGQRMEFASPLPGDIARLISAMREGE